MELQGFDPKLFQAASDEFDKNIAILGKDKYQRFQSLASSSAIPSEFWQNCLHGTLKDTYLMSVTLATFASASDSGKAEDPYNLIVEGLLGYKLEKPLAAFYFVHYGSAVSLLKTIVTEEELISKIVTPLNQNLPKIEAIERELENNKITDPAMQTLAREAINSTQQIKNEVAGKALGVSKMKEFVYKEIGVICKVEEGTLKSLSISSNKPTAVSLEKIVSMMNLVPSLEDLAESVKLLEEHFALKENKVRFKAQAQLLS